MIFAGHGYYSQSRKTTMLELRKGEEIDSLELRAGAPKQTLILDCCRKIEVETLRKAVFAEAVQKRADIHSDECRRYYDDRIARCPSGIAVLWACSIGETAGDDKARGGYYSFSLLDEAESWAKDNNVDISRNVSILSVVGAHDFAEVRAVFPVWNSGVSAGNTPSHTKAWRRGIMRSQAEARDPAARRRPSVRSTRLQRQGAEFRQRQMPARAMPGRRSKEPARGGR